MRWTSVFGTSGEGRPDRHPARTFRLRRRTGSAWGAGLRLSGGFLPWTCGTTAILRTRPPTHLPTACRNLWTGLTAMALSRVRLIGHSMGGLVAMGFALAHPRPTAGVASIDIAPRPYPPEHGQELAALKTDIRACRSRAEVERLLLPLLPDARTRQFIMTNAVRDGDGFQVEAQRRRCWKRAPWLPTGRA